MAPLAVRGQEAPRPLVEGGPCVRVRRGLAPAGCPSAPPPHGVRSGRAPCNDSLPRRPPESVLEAGGRRGASGSCALATLRHTRISLDRRRHCSLLCVHPQRAILFPFLVSDSLLLYPPLPPTPSP